jgi:hypothetical protein
MMQLRGNRASPSALILLGLLAACATHLSPTQRQQLETKVYAASYERTFAATRDAFVNQGFVLEESDFDGGILGVSTEIQPKNPNTALGLSLLSPFGDAYMGRWGWAVVDLLLWPISIAWAMPSNYVIARSRWKEVDGNAAFEKLGPERTRLRVSLRGIPHDAEKYPVRIKRLQEEIERQLFIKEGDTLGGEPQ